MIGALFGFARPFFDAVDAETAHGLAIRALKLAPTLPAPRDEASLAVAAFGRRFPNPVGLAAGFDKQCEVPDALLALGFGFVEFGGVVPEPQPGNPRPRVFRLPRDEAVINRFGLNSDGLEALRGAPAPAARPARHRRRQHRRQQGFARPSRRLRGLRRRPWRPRRFRDRQRVVAEHAGPARSAGRGLSRRSPRQQPSRRATRRDRHGRRDGDPAQDRAGHRPPRPRRHRRDGARRSLDGLIVSNTTIARPASLREKALARETGGLSGKPLFAPSTKLLAQAFLRVERRMPLIGVGGVEFRARPPLRRSAPAPAWCSFTPPWSTRARASIGDIKADLSRSLAATGCRPSPRRSAATRRDRRGTDPKPVGGWQTTPASAAARAAAWPRPRARGRARKPIHRPVLPRPSAAVTAAT